MPKIINLRKVNNEYHTTIQNSQKTTRKLGERAPIKDSDSNKIKIKKAIKELELNRVKKIMSTLNILQKEKSRYQNQIAHLSPLLLNIEEDILIAERKLLNTSKTNPNYSKMNAEYKALNASREKITILYGAISDLLIECKEKYTLTEQKMVPKKTNALGLKKRKFNFNKPAIEKIIRSLSFSLKSKRITKTEYDYRLTLFTKLLNDIKLTPSEEKEIEKMGWEAFSIYGEYAPENED